MGLGTHGLGMPTYDITCAGCENRIKLVVNNRIGKFECQCGEMITVRKKNLVE